MGYLKSVGTAFIYISLLLAWITFLPGFPPDVPFSEYSITQPTELEGKLAINDRINDVELLHVGKIKGPESFDSYNGELYTTIHGGYVVKIDEKEVKPFVKFGNDCDGIWQEEKCGRPLGLKFDKNGNLYVVDSYYGIFKVDSNGKYEKVIDTSKPIAGKVPRLPNSVDIAENGDIYWTDSSTDFPLYDGIYSILADPSGRLLRYNAATKTNEVLLENLAFANGLLLSEDETFVIVSETLASRIIKYNLKGPKAGQKEIFSEGLPGLPDNIHSDNRGGFLVTTIHYADVEHPLLPQILTPHPYIRKMLVRLLTLVEAPFKLLQDVYPNFYAERLIHAIGSFETLKPFAPRITAILQYDVAGNIVDAAYATDGKMEGISSAFIHKDCLWFGSPYMEYIARIPLKQAFPHLAKTEKSIGDSNVHDIKNHPKIHSTTLHSQTIKTTTATPTSVTAPKPITTTVESTEASTLTKTTRKPSSTVEKKVSTSVPSTTVKTTTASKSATTSKPTETTVKSPKSNIDKNVKPNIKETNYKTIEKMKSEENPTLHSSKQDLKVKVKEKASIPKSDGKMENTKKTNSEAETNKQKVKNTQASTPKPVQEQAYQSGKSAKEK